MLQYLCHRLVAISQVIPVVDGWCVVKLYVTRVVERSIRRYQPLVEGGRHCNRLHGRTWFIGAIDGRIKVHFFTIETTPTRCIVAIVVRVEGWVASHGYNCACMNVD